MLLRIARPTEDLERIAAMYAAGLGMRELGRFHDHGGFDGIMVGAPDGPYHLEFTREHGAPSPPRTTPEHLLVFYVADRAAWESRCAAMERSGFTPVASHNPYWESHGRTYEDPEGYRIVIQNAAWPAMRE